MTHQLGGYQAPTLSEQYLGWGLVGVVVAGLVLWWRDVRLWLFAAVGLLAAFLSLGLSMHGWTLWRLVVHAPLMGNVIPSRFGIVVYLCAAVLLGLVCDHAYRWVATGSRSGTRPAHAARPAPGQPVAAAAVGLLVVAIALVPIAAYLAQGLPLTVTPVRPPLWFRTVAPHLSDHQVLVVFPFAFRQSNMTWQAVDGMSYAMVGGGGPDSIPSRAGRERVGEQYLADISLSGGPQVFVPGQVATVRDALDGWGVTGVVLPDPRGLPEYEQVFEVRAIVVLMTAATGRAPQYVARAWVWRDVDTAGPPSTLDAGALTRCAAGPADGTVPSIEASAACALAAPTPA